MSSNESYLYRWKAAKSIFAAIMIINIGVIVIALALSNVASELPASTNTLDTPKLIDQKTAIFASLGIIIIVDLVGFVAIFKSNFL